MMMMTSSLAHHCSTQRLKLPWLLDNNKLPCEHKVSIMHMLSKWVACRVVVSVKYQLTCSVLGLLTKGIS